MALVLKILLLSNNLKVSAHQTSETLFTSDSVKPNV